ncbi:MAG TPA: TonB-dependent receptor [Chitinophagaceae bacterium]
MKKNLLLILRWSFIITLCLIVSEAHSQQTTTSDKSIKEIRGTITDSSGAAVAGVSITVKNKPNIGTTTDLNGKFLLNVPADAVLVISMVGYSGQEISVKGQEVINLSLKSSTGSLDDVVVVAYGKQKRKEMVGSVTSIKPSDLKIPSSNLTNALAGRLAGVIAYQRSGEPGQDNAEFFIRGVTTFGYKKDPLILIDGIEFTATELARLNPDDIASFSIMKDATANALYGARGANGVILITTKEGKTGKAKINVRIENSISSPTREVELADPVTYMLLHNESVLTRNPLGILPYFQSKIDNTIAGKNPYMFPTTDWKKELLKDQTLNQRVNLNVSGGGQIARYYLAASFNQDNGNLKVDKRNNFNSNINLKTYVLRSNVNINVTKTTEVIVRLHGSFDDYTGPMDGGTGMYRKIMRTNPVLFPAYYPVDDEHQFTNHILFGNYDKGNYVNPYADLVKGYKDYSRSLMLAQVEGKQDLSFVTRGLSARFLVNTNRQSYFDVSRFYNPFFYNAGGYDRVNNTYRLTLINPDQVSTGVVPQGGTDYLGYSEGTKTVLSNFYFEAAANYNRTFNDKHGISGLVVVTARNQLEGNASDLQKSLPSRNLGVSGRTTYSYDNRYFGEFNFGYNGSERFYKTERFGFFPSAGLAWFISNEKFFEGLTSVFNKVKLRATYGLVGNDAIGSADDRFFYLSNVNMNNSAYGYNFGLDGGYNRNGISISRYDNQGITWETAKKTNLALEVNMLRNKLEIIAEVFREKRYNILMDRLIPASMGLQGNAPKANLGKASGKGMDISIDYSNNFGKNWIVTARGNFTYATSRFDFYEEPQYAEKYKYRIGHPLSQQWGYIAERLFVDDADVRNSPPQFGSYMAGDIKFRDVNGDGVINTLDQVPIGYPTTPEIIYGFGVSAKYKGFDISSFFQGSARSSFWIDVAATSPFVAYRYSSSELPGYILQNQLLKAYADDHWSEENRNQHALWPRLSSTVNDNNDEKSTWFMRDGSFLRLKQVELGYSLPLKLLRKYKMDNLRIYANGTNLLTFSKFKLWDIEMAGNGLAYPIQRVINFGIQVGL